MTIIEVLVGLAIVSFTVIAMLSAAALATRDATINKVKLIMNDAAINILNELQSALQTEYNSQNWNTILSTYISLAPNTNGDGFLIQNAPTGCNVLANSLSSSCPNVADIFASYNLPPGMKYVINSAPTSTAGIYEVSVHVACSQAQDSCNADIFGKITIKGYVVQY